MVQQSLIFNILTFNWPKQPLTFYFSKEESGRCHKLHKSLFPKNVNTIFPEVNNSGSNFIYTTFTGSTENFIPLTIDVQKDNPYLIKRYYDRQINFYFRVIKKQIVKVGFIKENQIWLLQPDLSNDKFDIFEKFSLKVQLCTVSDYPEILISYDGMSKVSKKNIADLIKYVPPACFNWVLFSNQLYKYKDLPEEAISDYEKVFPILNPALSRALSFPTQAPGRENRYPVYFNKIKEFCDTFIYTEEFKELIPLRATNFLEVNPLKVNTTNPDSNILAFGNNKFDIVPNNGIKNNGPFKPSSYNNVHLFFIVHKDDKQVAVKLKSYFENGLVRFEGLYKFAKVLFHTEDRFSIIFHDKDNLIVEIEQKLADRSINPDIKYIAIYISPYSKFENDLEKREIYYRIKELLLKRGITSQTIEANKVISLGEKYWYSLANIAVAILAKLDGIPWRLNTPIKNELIVGVGAFKHVSTDVQYIGSAFSFNNTGGFNRFEYFMKHEIDILAGSISRSIREYATVNSKPDRLIIHFYKTMSEEELLPIQNALENLGLKIPVFIVTINKTESEDIVAFDTKWTGRLMPASGTYINIGDSKYLLFNNTRYSNGTFNENDGYPFPIKLHIDCTDKKQLQETRIIKELIDQVYQFSRMYWKSVRQQNLPVTIKYPEMLAQIAPHFEGEDIPLYGRDNLWFL